MDDQQKSRLILLACAGVFAAGGGIGWVMTQNNKAEKAANQAAIGIPGVSGTPGIPVAGTPGAAPAASSHASSHASSPTTIALATLPGSAAIATTTSAAIPKTNYPATRREEAASIARQVSGREDPMQSTFEKIPYPGTKAGSDGHKSESPVPPPPTTKELPPAPSVANGGGSSTPELPIENMPLPPDKPMVTLRLKLTAILGNKALLSVPLELRLQNNWPAVICLGPGERFEDPANGSFSIVSVDRDSVTIEEEQESSVQSLPLIK